MILSLVSQNTVPRSTPSAKGTHNLAPLGMRSSRSSLGVVLQLRHVVQAVRQLAVLGRRHNAEFVRHAPFAAHAVEADDSLALLWFCALS